MNPVEVLIKFGTAGLSQVQAQLGGLQSALQRQVAAVRSYNASISNGSRALQTILTQAAAVLGGRQVLASLRSAREEVVALAQLRSALASTGQAAAGAEERLRAVAAALEEATGFEGEVILAVQRTLLTLGATADQVAQLTPLVLDLARAQGQDAVAAARLLGAALDGETVRIGRLNLEAKSFSGLITELNTKVGGQARAWWAAQGPLAALAREFRELGEAIGTGLLPLVDRFAREFTPRIREAREAITEFAAAHPGFLAALQETAGVAGRLGGDLGPALGGGLVTLLAVMGAWKLLAPVVNVVRTAFFALGGEMQVITRRLGLLPALWGHLARAFSLGTAAVTRHTAALRLLGTAGLGITTWFSAKALGEAIAEVDAFGDTLVNRLQRQGWRLRGIWAWVQHQLGVIDGPEFTERLARINQIIADTNPAADARDKDEGRGDEQKPGGGEEDARAAALSRLEQRARDLARRESENRLLEQRAAALADPVEREEAILAAWRERRGLIQERLRWLQAEAEITGATLQLDQDGKGLGEAALKHQQEQNKLLGEEAELRGRIRALEADRLRRESDMLGAALRADWRLTNAARYRRELERINELERAGLVPPAEAAVQRDELGPDPDSAGEQFEARWTDLLNRMGTFAENLSATLMAPIEGFRDGLAQSLDDLIARGGTAGEFFQGIALNIGAAMRRAFAGMVADYVTSHVVMRGVALAWNGFLKLLRAADIISANAAEKAKMPALATNATLASVGSWGLAVAIGLAAIAGILASVGAFARGGETPGTRTLAWVGEEGKELVLPAPVNARLNAAQKAALVAGDFSKIGTRNAEPGTPAAGAPPAGGGGPTVVRNQITMLGVYDSETAALKALEGRRGRAFLVDFIRGTIHETTGRA